MPNTIEVADVTRRLSSDNVRLTSDTRVVLCAYLDDQKKVNLLFKVFTGNLSRPYGSYEVEEVLDIQELPQPTGNKQQWEKVRKLMQQNDQLSPDDAWFIVAIGNAVRKWKFSMEEDTESSFSFSISVPRRSSPLEAKVQWSRFFHID